MSEEEESECTCDPWVPEHECPGSAELHDADEPVTICNCCERCTQQCRDDI